MNAANEPVSLSPKEWRNRLRYELRVMTIGWVYGSLWLWIISGATFTRFTKGLGASDWVFGLMAAIPSLAILFQFPGSYLLERTGKRKAIFLWFTAIHRLLWIAVAAIPWLVPEVDSLRWQVMVVLLVLSWCIGNVSGPSFWSWAGDIVPRKIRGRFFGFRSLVGRAVGLAATLLVGWLLDHTDVLGTLQVPSWLPGSSSGHNAMLVMTSLLLAIAGGLGAMDTLSFLRIEDRHPPTPTKDLNLKDLIFGPMKDVNFRRLLSYQFFWGLAVTFLGQYLWLYLFDVCAMGNNQANLLLIAVPLLMQIPMYRFWGAVMDRVGQKPVLIVATTLSGIGGLGWMFVGPDAAKVINWDAGFWSGVGELLGASWGWNSRLGYVGVLMVVIAWPGIELALSNLTMDMIQQQKKTKGGTASAAMLSVGGALGGTLSGLLAAWVVSQFKTPIENLKWQVPLTPIPVTYHSFLFLFSVLLRFVAVAAIWRMVEPKAHGTRMAIQYMGSVLYSNASQMVQTPMRLVGHAYRWSYLLSVPVTKRGVRFGRAILPAPSLRHRWRRWFGISSKTNKP